MLNERKVRRSNSQECNISEQRIPCLRHFIWQNSFKNNKNTKCLTVDQKQIVHPRYKNMTFPSFFKEIIIEMSDILSNTIRSSNTVNLINILHDYWLNLSQIIVFTVGIDMECVKCIYIRYNHPA